MEVKKIEYKGVKFLFTILALYIVLFVIDFQNISEALNKSVNIIFSLIPIFIFIILLTTLINYFMQPKKVMKYFEKNNSKKSLLFMILGGILSHGPMYAWYGILNNLREHGLKDGLIIVFLYARTIKLPLLPFMVEIFGIVFTIVINLYIIIFAVVQGIITDKIIKKGNQ